MILRYLKFAILISLLYFPLVSHGTAFYDENFDRYTVGNLNGNGGWTSNVAQIVSDSSWSPYNSVLLKRNSGNGTTHTATLSGIATSTDESVYFYVKLDGITTGTNNPTVLLSIKMRGAGNVDSVYTYYAGFYPTTNTTAKARIGTGSNLNTGYTESSTAVPEGFWYPVRIDVNHTTHLLTMSVNGADPITVSTNVSATTINELSFSTVSSDSNVQSFHLDDIHLTDINGYDNTYFSAFDPGNVTLATSTNRNVLIKYTVHWGGDSLYYGSQLYNRVCVKLVDMEASSTVAFSSPHCRGDVSTIQDVMDVEPGKLPYDLYQYMEVPLVNGYNGFVWSIETSDGYILTSTSTAIIYGTSSIRSLPSYSYLPTVSQNSYNMCAINNEAYNSLSVFEQVVLGFKRTLCEAFIPTPPQLQSFIASATSTLLNFWPVGYVTDFVRILATTSTTSLTVISATIPTGVAGAGSSISLTLDHSIDYILNATTSTFLNSSASSTRTLYQITNDYWEKIVYLLAFVYIVSRILGSRAVSIKKEPQ